MIIHPAKAYLLSDYEQFIAHLAHAREDQGITFAEIGERAGCYLQQAHNWINGAAECRARRLFSLAHALGYDLALVPQQQPDPVCDCGHEGLHAMFHLTPCPIALLRREARKLGYDLARIGEDPYTPDVDYTRGAAEALAEVAERIADLDGTEITMRALRQVLEAAEAELGVADLALIPREPE